MNQPKRVLPRFGNNEENEDSNDKKEKEKGKHKILLEEDSFIDEDESMNEKEESQRNETSNKPLDSKYDPCVPFTTALIPQLKLKKKPIEEEEIMKLFQKFHINIPLLDAIKHVLSYAKFIKSLCTSKKEIITINLSTEVSAFISNTLPSKQKDPNSPLVSCSIGNLTFRKALLEDDLMR